VRRCRALAAEAAGRAGAQVAALATSPVPVEPEIVAKGRYLKMAEVFGLTAHEQLPCACGDFLGGGRGRRPGSHRALAGDLASLRTGWDQLEARLAVFGSAAVFSAMQASRKAHEQLDLATAQHSNERFEHTFEAAEAADNRLIELVRTELHGKSEPLPDVKEQS
jgi:hypothetical protein